MKTFLVYPIPFNVWDLFDFYVYRFVKSFKAHPPGADYELILTCNWGEPTDEIHKLFYGTKAKFIPYYGGGCQIGAQQAVASTLDEGFIIGFTTHAWFHRAGWLDRLMKVRREQGPGLYGVCPSLEGKAHLRTSCYGMDAGMWHQYPRTVESREDCSRFECGDWCLSEWFINASGMNVPIVYWDSVQGISDAVPNGYRDGNQEQLLVWDRHTDIYEDADDVEKKRLSDMARGISLASNEPKE